MTEPVTTESDPEPFTHGDDDPVQRRTLDEQLTAIIGDTVELDEIGPWVSGAFGRVAAALAAQRVAPAGPPYARYFPVGDRRFHVEAGFPVHCQIEVEGGVGPTVLPAGPALATVHTGPYDEVSEAYDRIAAWAAEHGLTTGTDPWEIYVTDPSAEPDPSNWRTEIVVPVVTA